MRITKLFEHELDAGSGDGDVLLTIKSLARYNRFAIETIAGSAKILPSLDGTDYNMPQLVLSQEPTVAADAPEAQEGTLVAKTTANVPAYFFGDFRGLQVKQVGATATHVRILAGGDE